MKNLKALRFNKIRDKKQNCRNQATAFEAGRFKFQKRCSLLKGERGREAVVYMEGMLIVGLAYFHLLSLYKKEFSIEKTDRKSPIHNSKTLEVPAREKRVIKNVCKRICRTIFILNALYFTFPLCFCNLNLMPLLCF